MASASASASAPPPPPGARFGNLRVRKGPELGSTGGGRAEFDVVDEDLCVVNALRRAVLADVPTAAFRFDPHAPSQSGIAIKTNTSTLHNEFLGHRLSLVPVGLNENQMRVFEPWQYRFILRVKNTGTDMLPVTTGDIEVLDNTGAKLPPDARNAMFPANPLTRDHILLVRLRPSAVNDRNGEEVHVECSASLGTGRQHARWSPVSTCYFRNKPDQEAANNAFQATLAAEEARRAEEGLGKLSERDLELLRHQHDSLNAHRFYVRNEHGDPAAFEFAIETECALRPTWVLFKAMLVLRARFEAILAALREDADAVRDESALPSKVDISAYPNTDDFYQVVIRGEDHTVGNLLQGLLYRRWVRDGAGAEVPYIGYHQPHPLEDHVVVKIKCAVLGDDVRARMTDGVAWVRDHMSDLALEWAAFSGLDKAGIVEVDDFIRRAKGRTAAGVVRGGPTPPTA